MWVQWFNGAYIAKVLKLGIIIIIIILNSQRNTSKYVI